MKKITINNIIKFRHRNEKNQKAFLNSIQKKAETKSDGGGNYWIRSLSALSNAVKSNEHEPIKEKIGKILEVFSPDLTKQTRDMYQRNLDILHNYEDFDFSNWLPNEFEILSKTNKKTIIYIKNVPVQITPSQIFKFDKNGDEFVGALWFVAKLEGYKIEELGMFAEALFIFLSDNFNKDYKISKKHCIIVDVLAKKNLSFKEVIKNKIPAILKSTLDSISKQL
jgi:hypothetical protein